MQTSVLHQIKTAYDFLRKSHFFVLTVLAFALFLFPVCSLSENITQDPLLVEFFYQSGCDQCAEVQKLHIPELLEMFGDRINVKEINILDEAGLARLVTLLRRLGLNENPRLSIVINEKYYLGNIDEIRDKLAFVTGKSIEQREIESEANNSHYQDGTNNEDILVEHMRSFNFLTVLLAGLADGLNPCAFATIVFFISLLAIARKGKREMLLMGLAFCVASFFTYLGIGLGTFEILRSLPIRGSLASILKMVVAGFLLILAFLSFRDARLYKRTGTAKEMALRLPDKLINKTRSIIRARSSSRRIFVSSAIAGFLVTLIESVCTGQLYLPTLVFLTTSRLHYKTAWSLLILYNLAFILPLIAVFLAAYFGISGNKLNKLSKLDAVHGKILLGLVFLLLAILLIFA